MFEDADLDRAIDWALVGIMCNAGQVCSATSRVLVQESIAVEFTRRLVLAAQKIKVGDPLCPSTQVQQ